jgi:CobQ-like glutamine amidotransferase family enzyme
VGDSAGPGRASTESAVRIALVYPSLLGTYGDGGNASVLAQRLRWRRMPAEVIDVAVEDPLPATADLYVFGGGEDAAQTLAVSRLSGDLAAVVGRGATVFAVCAGFQILGETFLDGRGGVHPGLGLIDCRTERLDGPRAVGELLVDAAVGDLGRLTGYENHGGRTVLGPDAAPLGRVVAGVGNGAPAPPGDAVGAAADGAPVDGAVQGTVVATYLHGPALARNPRLADWLLARVVGRDLPSLPDPAIDAEVEELRRERIGAVLGGRRRLLRRARDRQWRPPARG